MLYILLCICFSVIVSVMFKLAKRYQIDVYQAITWNYSMAIFLTLIFLKPDLIRSWFTAYLVCCYLLCFWLLQLR